MVLPDYKATKMEGDLCQILFDPPVTKAQLGIPFSYLVLQRETTEVDTTRFGRVMEVRCDPSHWVAFLETRGEDPEKIAAFKESVGHVDPVPEEEEEESTEPAKAASETK